MQRDSGCPGCGAETRCEAGRDGRLVQQESLDGVARGRVVALYSGGAESARVRVRAQPRVRGSTAGLLRSVDQQHLLHLSPLETADLPTLLSPHDPRPRTFESIMSLSALAGSAFSSMYMWHTPSACPSVGIRVDAMMCCTMALLPRGITRSMAPCSLSRDAI
jgi:hypothetical protein